MKRARRAAVVAAAAALVGVLGVTETTAADEWITTPTKSPDTPAAAGTVARATAANAWKTTLSESFDTPAAAGTVAQVYAKSLVVYDDGPVYRKSNLSVSGGSLQLRTTAAGTAAGFFFRPTPTTRGQVYGRFTTRFRVFGASGYGAAFLLWPNSNDAWDGELDFPESDFDKTMRLYHHKMQDDPAEGDCTTVPRACPNYYIGDTKKSWRELHTAVTEWAPDGVRYYLDGVLLKEVREEIPQTNHRLTIQAGPSGRVPPTPGVINIYSVRIEARA